MDFLEEGVEYDAEVEEAMNELEEAMQEEPQEYGIVEATLF